MLDGGWEGRRHNGWEGINDLAGRRKDRVLRAVDGRAEDAMHDG